MSKTSSKVSSACGNGEHMLTCESLGLCPAAADPENGNILSTLLIGKRPSLIRYLRLLMENHLRSTLRASEN